MTDLLQTIQNEVAKENGLVWDHNNTPETRIDRLSLWPEVCKRYAFEVAKAALKNASENAKFNLVNDQNPNGLKVKSYANHQVAASIDKESITDESNIVL